MIIVKGTFQNVVRQKFGEKLEKVKHVLQIIVAGKDGKQGFVDIETFDDAPAFAVGKEVEIPVWINAYTARSGAAVVQYHQLPAFEHSVVSVGGSKAPRV